MWPGGRVATVFRKLISIFYFLIHASSIGHVTWDEYRVKFLASKGFNEKEIVEKIKNNEDLKLDEESKYRTMWSMLEYPRMSAAQMSM